MSEFDEAFGSADATAFDVMGEDIVIGGETVRAVRDDDDYSQQLGEGGFLGVRSCSFYISTLDADGTGAAPGSRVEAGGKAWVVGSIKDLGGYRVLTCMASSGQQTAEF